MAVALKPLNRIKLFFQGLSGSFDVEYDEDTGYDKAELDELNKMSSDNITKIEEKHGKQTIIVEKDEQDKDRLGIKKPKIIKRSQHTQQVKEEQQETDRESGR